MIFRGSPSGAAGTGPEFFSVNPATGFELEPVNSCTADDVAEAVTSASWSQRTWGRYPFERRAEILRAFAGELQSHREELTRAISDEVGKPLWDAGTEVDAMVAKVEVSLRALMERRSVSSVEVSGGRGWTRYRPHGVVAVFAPFNFPGHIANGQIVPALAAGNSVIFKPSELTPWVGERIFEYWRNAGLPPGVLKLVQGGKETGQAIVQHAVQHPEIGAIFFTGSLTTGIALQRALVDTPRVLLALELGGVNPLVIHKVSNTEAAVNLTIQSAYITSGQRCTCARRLIVTPGNEEFLSRLARAVNRIRVGRPKDSPEPFMGPMIRAAAVDKVLSAQQRLVEDGASILVEARPIPELGPAFLSPGLIDVTNTSFQDETEIFGPLLQVIRAPSWEAALNKADETVYGLVASLFSDDRQDFETFFNHVHAGLVNWNRPTTGASGLLPFGGMRESGNHRPAGYFMVDSCNIPVASMESEQLEAGQLPPGMSG